MRQLEAWQSGVETTIRQMNGSFPELDVNFAAVQAQHAQTNPMEYQIAVDWFFVSLVNNRQYRLATECAAASNLRARMSARAGDTGAELCHREYSVIFCLAVLDVQAGGDPERALENFHWLQTRLPPDHALFRGAQKGEALAIGRLGRHISLDWPQVSAPPPPDMRQCPTCLDNHPKAVVLSVKATFPGRDIDSPVLRCSSCHCLFFKTVDTLEYQDEGDVPGPVLAFYLQLAAGIDTITSSIARSGRPEGTRFLDIGCGYGFGLDYANEILGWRGAGMDPCSLARAGAATLDLPIAPRYFTEDDTRSPVDVAMASEVLEHVADPRAFIALLRRAIVPGGLLILSTPNAQAIAPDTDPSMLLPALSVGAHIVLQTAESLEGLLHGVGLTHVVIEAGQTTLIAFASDAPFTLADIDRRDPWHYSAYLDRCIARSLVGSDLWIGVVFRAFRDATLRVQWDIADRHYAALHAAVQARFGIDLENISTLPKFGADLTPEALTETAPHCIANIVYARAQRLKAGAAPGGDLWQRFGAASIAARAIRPALRQMNADDYTLVQIEHEGAAEAACLASVEGDGAALQWLAVLSENPRVDATSLNRLAREIVVNLARRRKIRSALRGYVKYRPKFSSGEWRRLIAGAVKRLWH